MEEELYDNTTTWVGQFEEMGKKLHALSQMKGNKQIANELSEIREAMGEAVLQEAEELGAENAKLKKTNENLKRNEMLRNQVEKRPIPELNEEEEENETLLDDSSSEELNLSGHKRAARDSNANFD